MIITDMTGSYDLAVVGGGIIGLAHAYLAAKRGMSVAVFERSQQAEGASIRNFGLIWPIGQAAANHGLAMRSRELWLEVLRTAGLPYDPTGSLHVAYREDEAEVAREFARIGPQAGYRCAWLDPAQVVERSSAVYRDKLAGALWSASEITVDPRQVLAGLPRYLASEWGVKFYYGAAVQSIEMPELRVGEQGYRARRTIVCPGSELGHLYRAQLAGAGLRICKLQMMRTRPQPHAWRLGPALAGGLTLRFYPSFQICSSLQALRDRIARETPEFDRWGIHTMVSQGADGSLTFGDSHEYEGDVSPFLRSDIEELILSHIETYLAAPDVRVDTRWYGVYAKHPTESYCMLRPEENVRVVTGLGGAGMTLSFAVAEKVIEEWG